MRARAGVCRVALLAWVVFTADASSLRAQVAAGDITGVIRDQAGTAVPGVRIAVTDAATNRQRIVTSSRDGVYAAPSLAPGTYRIDVELPGFKPIRREGVTVATGEKVRVDFELAIGTVSEQV